MRPTFVILLCAALAACSSSSPLAIESDTGRVVPADYLDGLRGMASGQRDAEAMRFADAVIAKAGVHERDEFGTTYPGTVKVIRWKHRGQHKHTALRLATWPNAPAAWQGPTPPSGFYGSKLTTTYLP